MNKGDIVLARACVYTKGAPYGHLEVVFSPKTTDRNGKELSGNPRPLVRKAFDKPILGLVIGETIRISGVYTMGHNWGDFESNPGSLWNPVYHKVILIEPLRSNRWTIPLACLEEDLEYSTTQNIE